MGRACSGRRPAGAIVKVLVTGGTSLLGRTTAQLMVERGDEVALFQRNAGSGELTEHLGSVTDPESLATAMKGVEAVVHLAAKVGVTGTWAEFASTNAEGTANVISAAVAAGVGRMVHVSSPSVAHAGTSLVGVGAEPADPETARGYYAKSKAQAEVAALAADGDDLAVVAIRPHLVWGPGDTQLIGRIVDRARAGRLAVVGSGLALIDTTYIDNAAAALVAGLDRAPELGGQVFVVSNGQPRTVRELFSRIVTAAGLEMPRLAVPTGVAKTGGRVAETWWARSGRSDDPPMTSFLAEQLGTAHWFDQRETRLALGWEPTVGIEEGFARLADWFQHTTS